MKKRTIFRLIPCLVALLALCAVAHAEPQLYSIQKLREVTSPVWQQTYQAYGRTITVDQDVYIPQAETAPVITVRVMPPLSELQRSELQAWYDQAAKKDPSRDYYFRSNDWDTCIYHAMYPEWGDRADSEYVYGEMGWGAHGVFDYDMDTAYAEDNALTLAEAFSIAQERLKEFFPDEEVFLRNVAVYDRTFWKKTNEPISKKGRYNLECTQLFHDIPYMASIYHAFVGQSPMDHEKKQAWREGFGTLYADIYDADAYSLGCDFFQETGVLYEDIPLLPFDAVRGKVEELILGGYVRYVDQVALGYVQYNTENPDELALVPSWVVWCEYVKQGPKAEPSYPLYTQGAFADNDNYFPLIFNAQTGELMMIGPENNDLDRCQYPTILTW